MGTNCAPVVADLFLFCYERDFLLSLSDDNQIESEVIEAFNSTSRYCNILCLIYHLMSVSQFNCDVMTLHLHSYIVII